MRMWLPQLSASPTAGLCRAGVPPWLLLGADPKQSFLSGFAVWKVAFSPRNSLLPCRPLLCLRVLLLLCQGHRSSLCSPPQKPSSRLHPQHRETTPLTPGPDFPPRGGPGTPQRASPKTSPHYPHRDFHAQMCSSLGLALKESW